jgi:general stress protein 26
VIVRYLAGELFMAGRRGTENPNTVRFAGLSMLNREAPLTGPAGGANIRADGRRAMIITSKLRVGLVVAVVAAAVLAVAASSGRAEISQRDAQALSKTGLIYIATVRKDGNQSRAAPVWFATTADNNAILIQTGPETWKAKRIRRGSPALVWIGSADGPAFIGKAEITNDASVVNKILTDFHSKYWQNRVFGVGPSRTGFESGECIAIRITPTRDLADGFTSAPGTPALICAPVKSGCAR